MHDQFSFASQTGFETVTKRFCRIDTDPEERDELPELPAHRAGCAVIGCGAGNSYGHPHGVVLERLESIGTEIYRTDLHGEIVFYTDGGVLSRSE